MIKIVDVTIRDGGYENNWNFSLNFVDSLIRGLAEAGIEYIEVGHGYGLGGERDFGAMAHTDREYLDLINKININAKIGMFANVNICKVDDVKLAGEFGLDFLRVGFIGYRSPHPMSGLPQLVGEAKRQGMFVSVNMVLSTLYSDKDLLENLKFIEDLGSDVIYLVDSTGGMLPNEVTRKIELLKTNSNILVGFHGHQNYDLAVANSLSAVKAGADFVDGTLLGLGRDLGNAQLEILINVLED
ncbi:MAG: 4-hydroxy-2-oxovalerate aldolase mhpE [Candidatus Azambacteria bacterium GW2011_GWA1_44_9]|nr:MAG: 4-hydroxy-2-oxovalerate aldolase mhpE [Candidatus Azambacteria bacterium GW2011_GWA1_44_9]